MPRFRTLGAVGWLVRPLRPESVVERVSLVLSGASRLTQDGPDQKGQGVVLVADDNPINAMIAKRALESAGFACRLVSTGREALDCAAALMPDLVLMDLRMPVMDGFEAIARLRRSGFDVPVVAVSADMNPEIESQAFEAGASGVASKPLDAETIRRIALHWTTQQKDTAA